MAAIFHPATNLYTMNVTFIGLGIMGSRMARHILDQAPADTRLTVWNRSRGPVAELAGAGATAADSAAAAVRNADLIITMLTTPEVVRAVVLDAGLLDEAPDTAIWADASTVDPAFARQCAAAADAAGIAYLGIPVSGTREPAARGELKTLVGGPAGALDRIRPVLQTYSSDIIHVGEAPDRGAVYKILINNLLGQSMLVFSETVRLGEALGLDRNFLLDSLPGMPVIAPFVATKVKHMRSGEYGDASFPLELMHKDLNLVVQEAYATGSPSPLAALSREIYGRARAEGRGRDDFSAVHG